MKKFIKLNSIFPIKQELESSNVTGKILLNEYSNSLELIIYIKNNDGVLLHRDSAIFLKTIDDTKLKDFIIYDDNSISTQPVDKYLILTTENDLENSINITIKKILKDYDSKSTNIKVINTWELK